jgi:hypothetical protein
MTIVPLVIVRGCDPAFVIVTVCGALVVPGSCPPKVRPDGVVVMGELATDVGVAVGVIVGVVEGVGLAVAPTVIELLAVVLAPPTSVVVVVIV